MFALVGHQVAVEFDLYTLGYALIVLCILIFFKGVSIFVLFRFINYGRSEKERYGMNWQVAILLRRLHGLLTTIMVVEAFGNSKEDYPQHKVFTSSIFTITFLTTLVHGLLTKPFTRHLKNSDGDNEELPGFHKEQLSEIPKTESTSTGEETKEPTKCHEVLTALDTKLKKWLLKDIESRNRQNIIDSENIINEARKWVLETPGEMQRESELKKLLNL